MRLRRPYVVNLRTGLDYIRIQDAIDDSATSTGDTLVADSDNWYFETVDFKNKRLNLQSGDITDPYTPNYRPDNTFISASLTTGSGVVTLNSSVIAGFTIRDGATTATDWGGGGIFVKFNSAPTISDCVITDNWSYWDGGGIYCDYGSSVNIINCEIRQNEATYWGGGIACYAVNSVAIKNCLVAENDAGVYGGGVYLDTIGAPAHIDNCTISGNNILDDSYGAGSGVYTYMASADVNNSIVTGNGNYGFYEDGAGADIDVNNCLLNDNMPADLHRYTGAAVDLAGSDGCFESDPLFVTGRLGNYYLSQTKAGQLADSNALDA